MLLCMYITIYKVYVHKLFTLYTWKPFYKRKKALLRKAGLNDLSRAV